MRVIVSIIVSLALSAGCAVGVAAQQRTADTFDAWLGMQVAERIARALPDGEVAPAARGRTDAVVYGRHDDWIITVDADVDGLVALGGEVPDFSFVQRALVAARRVPAIRVVENDIRLTRPSDPYGFFPYGYPYAAFRGRHPAR